ncbi:flavodoxin [Variovorax paradoxus]|uniref:flavodoxin family protein n=1 Tax=Variovorax paradoxus TaxID=34073 RepID=UPI0019313EB2|nr:flavodoxin [Variovorax paradoxus]
MNNVLVIVYSYTGTSRRVAELLCSQQGWPMAQITDARPRSGALGSWRCMLDSFFRRQPAIGYDGSPPSDFDAVVLVSPIWMLQLAGPMRSFVARQRDRLPDVAVLSVMGGQGAPNAVAEIGKLLGRSPVLSSAVTMREVDDGSCAARLQAFGTAIANVNANAEDSHAVVRPVTLSAQSI